MRLPFHFVKMEGFFNGGDGVEFRTRNR